MDYVVEYVEFKGFLDTTGEKKKALATKKQLIQMLQKGSTYQINHCTAVIADMWLANHEKGTYTDLRDKEI